MKRTARATHLLQRLPRMYPDAHCELHFTTPLELLVATILSAQCTDVRVNSVTGPLFARCRTAAGFASIPAAELEVLIRPTGFFRNKARNLRALGKVLVERHGGRVPSRMEDLEDLPGVGRKTANVVLGNAFGLNEGVVVDTHVGRLARRLGLTRHTDPVKVEKDLAGLFPARHWTDLSHWLIRHGRTTCRARNPDCPGCQLRDICPSAGRAAAGGLSAKKKLPPA
jgi:endonuclease III